MTLNKCLLYVLLSLLLMMIMSCSELKPHMAILDDQDKVVDVIVDMYIAEATINKQPITVRDSLRGSYRDNIILIHDLSDVEFDSLFLYIQTDSESYSEIHKRAVAKLNELNSSKDKD